MKYTMIRKGHYTGTDGANTATIDRVPEGCLHGAGWMWTARLNGQFVTNEGTLAAAKLAVANAIIADQELRAERGFGAAWNKGEYDELDDMLAHYGL
jgi:hypothetical protein